MSRDLNGLQEVGLVHRRRGRWMANHFVIEAYLPPITENVHQS